MNSTALWEDNYQSKTFSYSLKGDNIKNSSNLGAIFVTEFPSLADFSYDNYDFE